MLVYGALESRLATWSSLSIWAFSQIKVIGDTFTRKRINLLHFSSFLSFIREFSVQQSFGSFEKRTEIHYGGLPVFSLKICIVRPTAFKTVNHPQSPHDSWIVIGWLNSSIFLHRFWLAETAIARGYVHSKGFLLGARFSLGRRASRV